ncbi:hypothetical protein ACFE04_031756 [Oxalis oulophora]
MVDSDETKKLFLGGVGYETTEETLKTYFSQYGDVSDVEVIHDKVTGRHRGFAFISFSDQTAADQAIKHSHTIDGRNVDARKAYPRQVIQTSARSGIVNSGTYNFRTKKIFVGGLPSSVTEKVFRGYFQNYGRVTDVVVMYDPKTHRPRGFGFITYTTEDAVERVLHKNFHELNGKQVEVKPAIPKEDIEDGDLGYVANANSVYGQFDGSQFMQPQNTVGLMPYSGYGAFGYGYGGYTGYETAAIGFGGPGVVYPNLGAPGGGFILWTPEVYNNAWLSQSYAGFGASFPYGPKAASVGQCPSGTTSGYGNQGYGPCSDSDSDSVRSSNSGNA